MAIPQPRPPAGAKVRYAVVGLGWISQDAVLPAFANAAENSELVALVSGDDDKLRALGERYGVDKLYGYDDYDALLQSGAIDAVYIALPNSMHADFAIRAARAGIHVLCEKPMAVTELECGDMIRAAREVGVRLMVAYRLHFEACNLAALDIAQSGRIGEPRLFESVFTLDVKEGDIRLQAALGGGALYDIGIYCINTARTLFGDDPVEVCAFAANDGEPRFDEVDEMYTCMLRFPGQRLATFAVSFGAASTSSYRLVGTKGDLRVEPAYSHAGDLKHALTVDGRTTEQTFAHRDQFAPELVYFSRCVENRQEPEPSGAEGLVDVRVVRGLLQSAAENGRVVELARSAPDEHPGLHQAIERPPVARPGLVKAASPHKK